MDEKKLEDLMQNIDAPPINENAQKEALNLAMAEFQQSQKENEKKPQGLSLLSRLIGKTDTQTRKDPMKTKHNKKLIFGGMATAMAVVLIAGTTFVQLQNSTMLSGDSTETAVLGGQAEPTTLRMAQFNTDDGAARQQPQPSQKHELAEQIASVPAAETHGHALSDMAEMAFVPTPVSPPPASAITNNKMAGAPQALSSGRASSAHSGAMPGRIMPHMPQDNTPYYQDQNRDRFESFEVSPIKNVSAEPVSTFSIDVDTASYSFMRKQINQGRLPNVDSIRVEELINYFDYNYALPETHEQPFKPSVTLVNSPWNKGKQLMHIGIKGFDIDQAIAPPKSNIVFLLDVSGSMNAPDKLPLVKSSMKMLLDSLQPDDTVAIAVYAGAAGAVLEPTPARERAKIFAALDNLRAGGSTAGAAGINLAYQLAEQNFDQDGVNRVILATDGDFNVGAASPDALKSLVEEKRKSGIFLSVLGFGQGNLNDHMMQTIAQNGNGVAAYIDNVNEARKVLVEEATSTLFPIAKDVKIQIEFNPSKVAEYRLVGYETRALKREDFNNDKVDAGDIGAGHSVTAIYEITPVGSIAALSVDPLRYGAAEAETEKTVETAEANTDFGNEIAFLKMRYKLPNEDTSKLITTPIENRVFERFHLPSKNKCGPLSDCLQIVRNEVQFATAVASFGQLLKGGQYTGSFSYDDVIEMASNARGEDMFGYRAEFINLVRNVKSLSGLNGNRYQPQ